MTLALRRQAARRRPLYCLSTKPRLPSPKRRKPGGAGTATPFELLEVVPLDPLLPELVPLELLLVELLELVEVLVELLLEPPAPLLETPAPLLEVVLLAPELEPPALELVLPPLLDVVVPPLLDVVEPPLEEDVDVDVDVELDVEVDVDVDVEEPVELVAPDDELVEVDVPDELVPLTATGTTTRPPPPP